jgi:hypothetical protein
MLASVRRAVGVRECHSSQYVMSAGDDLTRAHAFTAYCARPRDEHDLARLVADPRFRFPSDADRPRHVSPCGGPEPHGRAPLRRFAGTRSAADKSGYGVRAAALGDSHAVVEPAGGRFQS